MVTTVTVTGRHTRPDGTPRTGRGWIIAGAPVILDAAGNAVLSGPVEITLDELGSWSVTVPATDDPNLTPAGFTYTLSWSLDGRDPAPPAVTFTLPAAVPEVEFVDLAQALPDVGVPTLASTGWRDITAEVTPAPVTWDFLHLKREGSRVTLRGSGNTTTATFGADTMPSGFRPPSSLAKGLYGYGAFVTPELVATLILGGSNIGMNGAGVAGKSLDFEESWLTAQAFPLPANYPGTPA